MKTCITCHTTAGPFRADRNQCEPCRKRYQDDYQARRRAALIESTTRSSAEIHALIVANVAAQEAVLADDRQGKAARIAKLQQEQTQLFAQKRAAQQAERGLAPVEPVGVRAILSEAERWSAVLEAAQEAL